MSAFFLCLEPPVFWGILLLLAIGGGAAFFTGAVRLQRITLVANTPTANLRSAAQGFGQFEGRAELLPGPPIVSPLTGTVCAWYRCKVYERQTDDAQQWTLITNDISDGLFLLRDYTGTAVIDPERAAVTPSQSLTWYTDSLLTGPPPSVGSALAGKYRCHEERIDLRARLLVVGHFSTQGSAQEVPDTPAETRALLNVWKRDQRTLLNRFDANGDGVIDGPEWEAARRAATEEVLRQQRERFGESTVNLISRPADGRAFIISTLGDEKLLRRWRREALLAFGGFAAAVGVIAWACFVRF